MIDGGQQILSAGLWNTQQTT